MPYSKRRNCPICFKPDLLSLSHHLSQVHQLSSDERQPWLKSAIFSPTRTNGIPPYQFWGMPQYPLSMTCKSYPRISTQSGKFNVTDTMLPDVNEQPKLSVKRKVELPFPAAKRSNKSSVKHKKPAVKREQVNTLMKQPKVKARTSTKRAVYNPRVWFTGGFQEEEQINPEEEPFSSDEEQINFEEFNSDGEIRHCTQDELNALARQTYRVGNSKGGFGPRFAR